MQSVAACNIVDRQPAGSSGENVEFHGLGHTEDVGNVEILGEQGGQDDEADLGERQDVQHHPLRQMKGELPPTQRPPVGSSCLRSQNQASARHTPARTLSASFGAKLGALGSSGNAKANHCLTRVSEGHKADCFSSPRHIPGRKAS